MNKPELLQLILNEQQRTNALLTDLISLLNEEVVEDPQPVRSDLDGNGSAKERDPNELL